MDLENLNQFSKKDFKKYFGIYIKERRKQLNYSIEELSEKISVIDCKSLKLIEAGHGQISQSVFDLLSESLDLDPQVLIDITRLTQVQRLLGIYAEINELYPK